MACAKHPLADRGGGPCPVCLLEQALGPHDVVAPPRHLTVCLPLGITGAASVYLVRQEVPSTGLLRLKTFNRAAPADYLDRFGALRERLSRDQDAAVVVPLAASVDGVGRPSVLSEFRRGVPVLDAVRSGAVPSHIAVSLVSAVAGVLEQTHAWGLAHGSLVSGNVLVRPDTTAAFLVDFGLAALLVPELAPAVMISRDHTALATLIDAIRSL